MLLTMLLFALMGKPAFGLEFREGFTGGNCSRCAWIAAEGAITKGSDEALLDFMRDNQIEEYSNLIVINSPGGDLQAALSLGRLIRQRGMQVIVGRTYDVDPEGVGKLHQGFEGGVCASACVFVLMGGVVRELADADSKVGVHQFAPTVDRVWDLIGKLVDSIQPCECANYFKSCGYEPE